MSVRIGIKEQVIGKKHDHLFMKAQKTLHSFQ